MEASVPLHPICRIKCLLLKKVEDKKVPQKELLVQVGVAQHKVVVALLVKTDISLMFLYSQLNSLG